MAADTLEARQHIHHLIEQLGPEQIDAVARLLEVMVDPVARSPAVAPPDDEPVTEQDSRRFHDGQAWFANSRQNSGPTVSFEEFAAECGFTMDQIRDHRD